MMKVTAYINLILVHDESTFRSGEVSAKRWFFGKEAPFHSKGKGRSNMVSDFLVQHPSGPFFSLSETEYDKALVKYPQVSNPSNALVLIHNFSFFSLHFIVSR